MRDRTHNSVSRIYRRAFDEDAELAVCTYVAPDGTEYPDLDAYQWTNERDWAEGVDVDASGVAHQEIRTLRFDRSYLLEKGILSLNPAGHFMLGEERWDFAEGRPIMVKTGPVAGSHPMVTVTVRKAVELGSAEEGSEFVYRDME